MEQAKQQLEDILIETDLSMEEVIQRTSSIYQTTLETSSNFDAANFTSISGKDLEILFDAYDSNFFQGTLRKLLFRNSRRYISFRLSPRMTSAAGKTTQKSRKKNNGKLSTPHYEIAISTTLLFESCSEGDDDVIVTGIHCHDRLEVLQRIFEHELVHLCEMLAWQNSSCSQHRFRVLAMSLFGHTETRHQLMTPKERAKKELGIKVGGMVSFSIEGEVFVGVVNRITKRATVLVESEDGEQYSDGKSYTKYYVPLSMLRRYDP